ncbi:MAG: response regulator [Bacteroidetes bacterium]|nr:response regulator [Bacteroidota bacterium]
MKKDLRILIVEDNLVIADDLKFILQDLGYSVTGIAISYEEALELILQEMPDLCLLDVVLQGKKDGVDLAETINRDFGIPFLFITSHSDKDTVERVKKTLPKGYVVKPFDNNDVFTSIELAIALSVTAVENEPFILIRHGGSLLKICINDILYVKADGNYIEIYTDQNKKYAERKTLKEFLQSVDDGLIQVHKSFAVNRRRITALNSSEVIVQDIKVPVGKTFYGDLKNQL